VGFTKPEQAPTSASNVAQVIDFAPITSMYGAVHCSSQVVRRTPSRQGTRRTYSALSQEFNVGSMGKSAPLPIRSPYGSSSRNIYSFSPAGVGARAPLGGPLPPFY
jgi:hypothetical protein